MSSLEKFKSNFVDHVGIVVESMESGVAVMTLVLADHHRNSGGLAHGGVLASLADSAGGAAAYSMVPYEKMAVTTDFSLTCLKSISAGSLMATARVIHSGRRFMRAEVKITSGDVLLATAGVSFMVIDRPNL